MGTAETAKYVAMDSRLLGNPDNTNFGGANIMLAAIIIVLVIFIIVPVYSLLAYSGREDEQYRRWVESEEKKRNDRS